MTTLMLALSVAACPNPAADPARLRARAALALAFADPGPQPGYPGQYARAVKEGKPLVVWVGQPARPVDGCLAVGCDTFPGAAKEAVVVGVPAGGGLRRVDLPGRPTPSAVQAAVRGTPAGGELPAAVKAGGCGPAGCPPR